MLVNMSVIFFCFGMAVGLLLSYFIEGIGRVAINIAMWVVGQTIKPLLALKRALENAGTSDTIVENVPKIAPNKASPGIGPEHKCPKHQTVDANCPLCFIGSEDY